MKAVDEAGGQRAGCVEWGWFEFLKELVRMKQQELFHRKRRMLKLLQVNQSPWHHNEEMEGNPS